ncbi:hypothetical protein KCG44_00955 [Pacificimonas sp. WHA3]|uniref:Uncharacterized protein n=1 Tax=Pacificimonas pallii TaxID=2827236 RepID=A0ABS6SAW5_9SPHN|nr:hypothetical protein [Pacificimonas pallii]MBV7255345.1 hypothetical protein [Pacificimonas pallii]
MSADMPVSQPLSEPRKRKNESKFRTRTDEVLLLLLWVFIGILFTRGMHELGIDRDLNFLPLIVTVWIASEHFRYMGPSIFIQKFASVAMFISIIISCFNAFDINIADYNHPRVTPNGVVFTSILSFIGMLLHWRRFAWLPSLGPAVFALLIGLIVALTLLLPGTDRDMWKPILIVSATLGMALSRRFVNFFNKDDNKIAVDWSIRLCVLFGCWALGTLFRLDISESIGLAILIACIFVGIIIFIGLFKNDFWCILFGVMLFVSGWGQAVRFDQRPEYGHVTYFMIIVLGALLLIGVNWQLMRGTLVNWARARLKS